MSKNNDILGSLLKYGNSAVYPFHMPGHKRMGDFPNPYKIDITEIDGFDNLHHAEGILRDSMDWAAGCYGADKTWYLVNGSTAGILSAISGIVPFGGKILMSRNCHKSVYHGAILNHLKTVYTYPQIIPEFGIQGGLSVKEIQNLLITNENIDAVFIVSPTYDGIVSDIEAISEVVHSFGIPLIVDEAHGAHFPYGKGFPTSALKLGADVVIQSLHKTLPSLTQTALLHAKKGLVDLDRVAQYLSVYQTSSPSYVLLASIEECIKRMHTGGREEMACFERRLKALRGELSAMKRLKVLDQDALDSYTLPGTPITHALRADALCAKRYTLPGTPIMHALRAGALRAKRYDIYDLDLSKIVVSCGNTNLNGAGLHRCLRDRYKLEMEMCGADYVTAITTVSDSEEGLRRLVRALLEIDESCETAGSVCRDVSLSQSPVACMDLWEGFGGESEALAIRDCNGYLSGEFVYLYPPGIPILAPGEMISGDIIDLIEYYKGMGLPVQGMSDKTGQRLSVLRAAGRSGENK